MIPITNYYSIYELQEDGKLVFKDMPREAHQRQFNSLVTAGMARIVNSRQIPNSVTRQRPNGMFLDDTELELKKGTAIKILKISIKKQLQDESRYYWQDWVKFSILHPSLKGIQFKTVGRYDLQIYGRENMSQLSKLNAIDTQDLENH